MLVLRRRETTPGPLHTGSQYWSAPMRFAVLNCGTGIAHATTSSDTVLTRAMLLPAVHGHDGQGHVAAAARGPHLPLQGQSTALRRGNKGRKEGGEKKKKKRKKGEKKKKKQKKFSQPKFALPRIPYARYACRGSAWRYAPRRTVVLSGGYSCTRKRRQRCGTCRAALRSERSCS